MSTKTTPCAFTNHSSSTMHRWKITALAAAVAAFGLYSGEASALALGKINVKSALGEPLRAEIEVQQITAAEADSLQVKTASSAVFRSQGMDYSGTASGIKAQLQRRANGTAVIVLSSQRPVNDPFVDYVVDANWNSGQVVRSYTMLFDPPSSKRAEAAVTTAPQITSAAAPAPVPVAPRPAPPVRVIEEPLTTADSAPAPRSSSNGKSNRPGTRANIPPGATNNSGASSAGGDSVQVQRGDTAGRIAAQNKPADVSLDQMLIAVMQANPHAFVGGNVNRMKSGVTLTMPSAEQARSVSASKARQMVAAQSRDFNNYRHQLAAKAAPAQVASDTRSAGGKVEAQVNDQKTQTAAPDQLKLSKEGAKGSKSAEASVSKAEQANADQARMSELEKNRKELEALQKAANGKTTTAGGAPAPASTKPADGSTGGIPVTAASPTAAAPAPAAAAPTPATPAPAAATPAAPAVAATPAAPAAAPAEAPAVVAAAPAEAPAAPAPAPAPAPKPKPVTPPPPAPEPSFFDDLLENPLLPAAGGAAILALLGGLWWRNKKAKQANAGASDSVMESSLSQDSFFGASGGQHIDTSVSAMTTGASSLAYTPSQLDAGDVDPVAEADVYLAYGRDLQAEEILKEALRTNPMRSALHAKLAEIYAKRKDRLALESIAKEARQLTGGAGPEWLRIAALGQELDPANALYQSGSAIVPSAESLTPAGIAAERAQPIPFENTQPPTMTAAHHGAESDFGPVSGLDFAMSGQLTDAPDVPAAPIVPAAAPVAPVVAAPSPNLNAGIATAAAAGAAALGAGLAATPAPAPAIPAATMDDFDRQLAEALSIPSELSPSKLATEQQSLETQPGALDFNLSDFDTPSTAQLPISDATTRTMDFDMTSLSLDLPGSSLPERTHPAALAEDVAGLEMDDSDPLTTKLTLAQEFLAIGDKEGARSLAQEVLAETTSATVKAQAQRLIDQSA